LYLWELEGIEKSYNITDDMEGGVRSYIGWGGGAAIAAKVGRNTVVPPRRQMFYLVTPRVP
jgi:hypothetical protein